MNTLKIVSLLIGLSALGCGVELKEPTSNQSSDTKTIIGGVAESGFSSVAMIQYLEPTNDGSVQVNPPLVCSAVWVDTVGGDAVLLTAAGCLWANNVAETDGLDNTTPGLDGVEVFFGQSATPGTALSIKDLSLIHI